MTSFHLHEARFLEGVDYRDLPMTIFVGPDAGGNVDLVALFVGGEIEYGSLFAYLFRRFGYPNSGWDPYKQLARYDLATPLADMVLRIEPHPGNLSCIHFTFLVPFAVVDAISAYPRRHQIAHARRRLDWIEANIDIPHWLMDEVAVEFNLESWQDAFVMLQVYGQSASGGDRNATRYTDWYRTVCEGYEAIEQRPALEYREADWTRWSDDDPFRQYVEAARAAIGDLQRPVGVRDLAINMYGPMRATERPIDHPHDVAGYPVGALGNRAPKAVCDLHALVLSLGRGDAHAGVSRVLEAFAQERADSQR